MTDMRADRPFWNQGLRAGDAIVEIDGEKLAEVSNEDMPKISAKMKSGVEMKVVALRNGKPVNLTLKAK